LGLGGEGEEVDGCFFLLKLEGSNIAANQIIAIPIWSR